MISWLSDLARALRDPEDTRSAVRAFGPFVEALARGGLLRFSACAEPGLRPETRAAWGLPVEPFLEEDLPRHPAARRWFLLHDVLHGLTGFPTTREGEALLGAFMLGAGDLPSLAIAATWPASRPRGMRDAFEWGRLAGPRVLRFPFERKQDLTLATLRSLLL